MEKVPTREAFKSFQRKRVVTMAKTEHSPNPKEHHPPSMLLQAQSDKKEKTGTNQPGMTAQPKCNDNNSTAKEELKKKKI
jgi:hypothetical protein